MRRLLRRRRRGLLAAGGWGRCGKHASIAQLLRKSCEMSESDISQCTVHWLLEAAGPASLVSRADFAPYDGAV